MITDVEFLNNYGFFFFFFFHLVIGLFNEEN